LARGAKSASFFTSHVWEVELKNVSDEPRIDFEFNENTDTKSNPLREFKPASGYILVRRGEENGLTKGGLYIPDESKERPMEGEVLSLGKKSSWLSSGDVVLYGKYSGIEVVINDEVLLLLKNEEVLGKFV